MVSAGETFLFTLSSNPYSTLWPLCLGGPQGDAGVTGRKIIVDTYGGWGAHGGGAFSGKDYSKVDRSAAYAARWVAKSLVSSGLARRALVQLSYAIGVAEPLSIFVESYGTSQYSSSQLVEIIRKNFDLRPGVLGTQPPVSSRANVLFSERTRLGKTNLPSYRFVWPFH